jgi:hypothetical protein
VREPKDQLGPGFQKPFWGKKSVTTGLLKIVKTGRFLFKTQNLNFMDKNWLIGQFDWLFSVQNSNIE